MPVIDVRNVTSPYDCSLLRSLIVDAAAASGLGLLPEYVFVAFLETVIPCSFADNRVIVTVSCLHDDGGKLKAADVKRLCEAIKKVVEGFTGRKTSVAPVGGFIDRDSFSASA